MMESALQGSLQSFKLPDVLTFLNTTRKSGTLKLTKERHEATIYYDDGELVFAAANQDHLRLGAVLYRAKRLTREQLQELEEQMIRTGEKFGQVAISHQLITEEELRDFLKIQVCEIIFDCFVWGEGRFSFTDIMNLPSYAVTIALDLTNLIMEGARRIDEWERLLQLLPDSRVVFRVSGNPQSEGKITLTREEWKLLFLINGQRNLEQLAREADESALQVYKLVYGLYSNKLIEPVTRASDHDQTDQANQTGGKSLDDASATMRQDSTLLTNDDPTVHVISEDDRNLIVSPEARLSFRDVVKTTVARLRLKLDPAVAFSLTDQEYRIGRLRENQIQLSDLSISGHHARIYKGPEGYVLEDLSSRNGTFVNGTRIFSKLLQDNDVVRFGTSELIYNVL
ncbi:MAG TPA: DUF4388 domain-containing protein [Thermoanaerobaculia bacterium]|nr:DUF4388 domain-containing protein [Thermoanaerobaculia bacterium]